jgi:hypothetical protein
VTYAYVIAALLGAGGLGTAVFNLFKGIRSVQGGARTRLNDLVDDLNEARKAAEEREEALRKKLRETETDRDAWRFGAWQYSLQLMQHGFEPIPPYGQPWPSDPPRPGGV